MLGRGRGRGWARGLALATLLTCVAAPLGARPALADDGTVVPPPQRVVPGILVRPAPAAPSVSSLARRAARDAQRAADARDGSGAAADNPLADHPWGTYEGAQDMAWQPYVDASGATKATLAHIALTPKAKWFGAWIPDDQIAQRVRDYVANAQHGDPDTLVQMTVFRMVPWEQEACRRLPTAAERASYTRWIDAFAGALGDTPAAIVLQPDGPFAQCAPGGSPVPSQMVAYASRTLSALPRTSVYVEVGSGDWPAEGQGGVDRAADLAVADGVSYARGIALGTTHYDSTEGQVRRGAAVVEALAARGITGKHVVVNTSGNGQPFDFGTYTGADPLNAQTCRSDDDPRTCVALGIPPTTDVADPRWGLPADAAALARRYVDAYLWVGRPWLYRQNQPFEMDRALAVVRSSPWF